MTSDQSTPAPSYNQADLFHLVEEYLIAEYGFKTVVAVDPAQMHEGFVLACGVKDGKAVQVKVSRDAMRDYLEGLRRKEETSSAEDSSKSSQD